VACFGYQAFAFLSIGDFSIRVVAESKDDSRAIGLPRSADEGSINTFNIRGGRLTRDTLGEFSDAATVSLRKRVPFGNSDVEVALLEVNFRHEFDTTLCIFNPCKSKHPVSFC